MTSNAAIKWVGKPVVFIMALIPLMFLVQNAINDNLGANPIEAMNRFFGDWALRFLLITLTVTPLRHLSGWNFLIRFRRMLGLFAFFYVGLHVSSYVVLDQFFDFDEIIKDIIKRPFITAGFIGFLMLLPLAVTSTNAMVRRLGGKRWRQLHRLVYAAGMVGVLHFFWMVKSDIREPLVYAILLAILLGYRVWIRRPTETRVPPRSAIKQKDVRDTP